jgi:hypothetical protein
MTSNDRLSKLGPLSGVLFVALELGGVIVGSADGRSMAALGDPTSKVLKTFSGDVGTGVWVGAYMELAAMAAFAVFAAWLFRSRRGPAATAGLLTAGVYIAITVVGLVVGDALEYGSTHGMNDQTLLGLFYLQSGLFFSTWGIAAAFLVLAPVDGWLRRAAVVIAGLLLAAMAVPTGGPSQVPNMLFLIWMLVAGVSLARRPDAIAGRAPLGAAT